MIINPITVWSSDGKIHQHIKAIASTGTALQAFIR